MKGKKKGKQKNSFGSCCLSPTDQKNNEEFVKGKNKNKVFEIS